MLTAITYNCDPTSLGDVPQEAFAEAFENEMRVIKTYGDLSITVTFHTAESEVTSWASDDYHTDAGLENTWREQIDSIAEKAFKAAISELNAKPVSEGEDEDEGTEMTMKITMKDIAELHFVESGSHPRGGQHIEKSYALLDFRGKTWVIEAYSDRSLPSYHPDRTRYYFALSADQEAESLGWECAGLPDIVGEWEQVK